LRGDRAITDFALPPFLPTCIMLAWKTRIASQAPFIGWRIIYTATRQQGNTMPHLSLMARPKQRKLPKHTSQYLHHSLLTLKDNILPLTPPLQPLKTHPHDNVNKTNSSATPAHHQDQTTNRRLGKPTRFHRKRWRHQTGTRQTQRPAQNVRRGSSGHRGCGQGTMGQIPGQEIGKAGQEAQTVQCRGQGQTCCLGAGKMGQSQGGREEHPLIRDNLRSTI